MVYGLIPYLNETDMPEINSFVRIAYGSLNRLAWSAAVGWVIFASTHGYGGESRESEIFSLQFLIVFA